MKSEPKHTCEKCGKEVDRHFATCGFCGWLVNPEGEPSPAYSGVGFAMAHLQRLSSSSSA